MEAENEDTNGGVSDFRNEWKTGVAVGPGAQTFMGKAKRPFRKEAAQQAVAAGDALISAAASSDHAETPFQMINLDSRSPEIHAPLRMMSHIRGSLRKSTRPSITGLNYPIAAHIRRFRGCLVTHMAARNLGGR